MTALRLRTLGRLGERIVAHVRLPSSICANASASDSMNPRNVPQLESVRHQRCDPRVSLTASMDLLILGRFEIDDVRPMNIGRKVGSSIKSHARSDSAVRAMACKAPRQRWHSRQLWHCGFCNLQNPKSPVGFESHPLRHSRNQMNYQCFVEKSRRIDDLAKILTMPLLF
jgi:hypothetical protein